MALYALLNSPIMKTPARILILISCLFMLSAYFLPLWHILLDAPQYPEGLEMKIWLNGLSGNIAQINGLNHYIGMKFISMDDFKEFKILPYVFGALTFIGIAAALFKSRKLLWTWFIGDRWIFF